MGKDNFYITTPIYYVNSKPHIGHAYTTILADVLVRCQRLMGVDCFFLTGTDEHGQKIQEAAEKNGITPQQQCDNMVLLFKELWQKLKITNDDFIRTTDESHKKVVQSILQELFDKELIYKAEYRGWYCVPCERFFTEKDLIDENLCPECKRSTKEIIESNYFFRMSKYQDWLIDYINTHKDFILPVFRANETLGFLKKPLSDLCISRPKSRLSWGIELPFDKDYVCYVWFDALVNYISAIGYKSKPKLFEKWWPASYHLMAKDILVTHTVYWTTMLKAMELEMPKSILIHGWWLSGQNKMSKSLGNIINPLDLIDKYGVDALRYFLMAEMTLGQDAPFTEEAFIRRYNTDLANDLGNFVNRIIKFILKQYDGRIPVPGKETEPDLEFKNAVTTAVAGLENSVKNSVINRGLEAVIGAVRAGNAYIEKTAPWKLAKNGETDRLNTVLYYTAESLRIIAGLLYPVMPEKAAVIRDSLGLAGHYLTFDELKQWGKLQEGSILKDPGVLFPRIV